jgi:hypothetical protein
MKVRELIAILYKCEQDDLVVVTDHEGTNFEILSGISEGNFEAYSPGYYCGDVKMRELTEEDMSKGYTEEEVGHGEDCIVIWPIG